DGRRMVTIVCSNSPPVPDLAWFGEGAVVCTRLSECRDYSSGGRMSAIEQSVAGGAVSRELIVGGGVSGLALANGLAADGVHVEVVERNPRTSGTAIGLWSFSIRALEKLGLKNALLATGAVS